MRDESVREHAEVPRLRGAPSPGNALLGRQNPLIGVKHPLKQKGENCHASNTSGFAGLS